MKYCKTPKINNMVHETLYLYYLNMISNWNIALTGASVQRCNEQWSSLLTLFRMNIFGAAHGWGVTHILQ